MVDDPAMSKANQFAHRTLRGSLSAYHDARDQPDLVVRWDRENEPAIGFYENPRDVEPRVIVITDEAIRFDNGQSVATILYSAIVRLEGLNKETGSRETTIWLRDDQGPATSRRQGGPAGTGTRS